MSVFIYECIYIINRFATSVSIATEGMQAAYLANQVNKVQKKAQKHIDEHIDKNKADTDQPVDAQASPDQTPVVSESLVCIYNKLWYIK